MAIVSAIRAFFKALKEPAAAERFLRGEQQVKLPAKEERHDPSHLRLLAILQQSGRLVDFFQEEVSDCSDAQLGAAVRKIHDDCRKKLEELVTVRPIFEEGEGERVQVSAGYDPLMVKVVGKVSGEPPYSGVIVHRGWKAHKRSLPKQVSDLDSAVLCPAEVEVR